MKATLLMKAAACLCPVTVLAASTAIVPPVRHAVHKATRPAQPADRPVHKLLTYASPAPKPCAGALRDVSYPASGDDAVGGGGGPLLDDGAGSPLGSSPGERFGPSGGSSSSGGGSPGGGSTSGGGSTPGGGGSSSGGGSPPGGGSSSGGPGTPGALPEPTTWLMMIMGFGGTGWVLRNPPKRRRRSSTTPRVSKWPRFAAGLGLTGYAAGAARGQVAKAAAAANGARWAMAAKTAALCVCPPVLVATTAATVPPVRNAVYHATAPATPPLRTLESAPPCIPDLNNVAPTFTGGDHLISRDLFQTVSRPADPVPGRTDQANPLVTAREDGPSSPSTI